MDEKEYVKLSINKINLKFETKIEKNPDRVKIVCIK